MGSGNNVFVLKKEKARETVKISRAFVCRGERIRTSDLLIPNQALYQAELRPVTGSGVRN
jgi:hypothetical protein